MAWYDPPLGIAVFLLIKYILDVIEEGCKHENGDSNGKGS